MKLFGNKRGGEHRKYGASSGRSDYRTYHEGDAPEKLEALNESVSSAEPKETNLNEKSGMSGKTKGIILLAVALAVCVATVWAVIAHVVQENVVEPTGNATQSTQSDKLTISNSDGETQEVNVEIPTSHRSGVYNILVLGTDNDGVRTDTIIVAHLDANTHTVALMSVPRDTLIYGDYSVPKINAVYGNAGQGEKGIVALEDKLETVLGFRVDGYVVVNLDAFEKTVDMVGGVDFDVPQDMYYSDPSQDLYINLKAGMQHLDGSHAEQLVRYRKYSAADIQRTKVQQDFLRALAKQVCSISTATKINELADIFYTYVKTDLTVGNMVYFGVQLLDCDFDAMKTYTLPGEGIWISGGSYYQLYASQVLEIVNESFNPYETDLKETDINIRYEDGTTVYTHTETTGSSNALTTPTQGYTTPTQSETKPPETTESVTTPPETESTSAETQPTGSTETP
jgi:LCP family protein required for cell wall assembly